jgi:hypothetical protein
LERLYVNQKEYDKAINILQRLQNMIPNAGGLQAEIQRIEQMKAEDQAAQKQTLPSSKK